MSANFHPPYTHLRAWDTSGLKERWLPTKNIYNSFGIVIARAIDDETAELIANALNVYKPVNVIEG